MKYCGGSLISGKLSTLNWAKTADRFAVEPALPSVLKDPLLQLWLPMDAGGKDTAGKSEILRVEFEHGQVGEAVLVLVEKLVIKNPAWFARLLAAKDPLLIWAVRRFAPAGL